jgi:hypothetical protein
LPITISYPRYSCHRPKEEAEEKRTGILRGCGSFLACVRMSCSGDALGFVGWHHACGGNG